MKKTTQTVLLVFAAGIMTLVLTGFNTLKKPRKQPLIVERQQCILQFMVGAYPGEDSDIGITIDVPISGDPVLVDSVMHFLNHELYGFLDWSDQPHVSQKKAYCAEPSHLLSHYQEAYKPYMTDTCYRIDDPPCCTNGHYLSVTLLEQTQSFVTYQAMGLHIGEGDCEYLQWTTLDKSDGHRLAEVVDADHVNGFVMELCNLEDAKDRLSEGDEVAWRFSFGLTTDSLRVQYMYAPGIVETMAFDMKTAYPYLSKEAKELLK